MAEKNAEGPSPSPLEDDGKLEDLSPFRVAAVGASLSKYNAHNFLSRMLLMKNSYILFLASVLLGMIGFYIIPGLVMPDAGGSPLVNAFYCAVMTLTT